MGRVDVASLSQQTPFGTSLESCFSVASAAMGECLSVGDE